MVASVVELPLDIVDDTAAVAVVDAVVVAAVAGT